MSNGRNAAHKGRKAKLLKCAGWVERTPFNKRLVNRAERRAIHQQLRRAA